MTTESKMQLLMPLLDNWMLTALKIQQLQSRTDYSKVMMSELLKLEYLQQSDLTNEWLKLNEEKVKSILNNH